MRMLFATDSYLHTYGLQGLTYQHQEYEVVVTEEQLKDLRNLSGMDDEDFDRIWGALQKEAGVRVETAPCAMPVPPDPELAHRLDKVLDGKLRYVRADDLRVQQIVRAIREEMPEKIALLKAVADQLGVGPIALAGPATREYFEAAGIPTLGIKEFRQGTISLRHIRRDLFWCQLLGNLKLFGCLFLAFIALNTLFLLGNYWTGSEQSEAVHWLQEVLLSLPASVLTPICVLAAFGLYFWRSVARLSYGMLEVGAGWWGIYYKVPQLDHRSDLGSWVTLFIAVYVIVRGLDNIGKGSKKWPWLAEKWRRIFGKDS